ncbi:MAG: SHOCT domain-containing protein [Ginsengibacter sp.]
MKSKRITWQRIGILIAAMLGIASAFLPWVTFPGINKSMNGFSGIGILVFFVFTGIALISILYRELQIEGKTFLLFTTAAGIGALFFIIMQVIDLASFTSLFNNIETRYGLGIWIKIIAAFLVVILSRDFKLRLKKPQRKTPLKSFENGISIPATFADNKNIYPRLSLQEKEDIGLEKLIALKQSGYITEEEFLQLKSKLILSDFLFGLFN